VLVLVIVLVIKRNCNDGTTLRPREARCRPLGTANVAAMFLLAKDRK
jgi:hypothetical protein